MKNAKKFLSIIFVIMLSFSMMTSVFATATPESTATTAGATVEVKFEYAEVIGVNGTFTLDNAEMFSKVEVTATESMAPAYNPDNGKIFCYADVPTNCVITLTLTVAETATVGESCTISFEHETTADGVFPTEPVYTVDTAVVYIGVELDYSALVEQIEIAEGLDESKYTEESWAAMIAVLEEAKALLYNAETQEEIDAMTAALKAAIEALVLKTNSPQTGDNGVVYMIMVLAAASTVGFISIKKRLFN